MGLSTREPSILRRSELYVTDTVITENGNIPNNFIRGMYHLTSEPDQTLKEHLKRLKAEAEEREAK